jgi:hypothetical protein
VAGDQRYREGPDREASIGVEAIGYQRSREREFCALQNRDTRFPDHDEGGPQKRSREKRTGGRRNRDSTYRESRGLMLFGIASAETPTEV